MGSPEENCTCRIAIVDDYAAVANTIAAYIKKVGCESVIFTNPLTFLDELKDSAFDIVITDIRMPEMDGISLLKKIKKRAPSTDVIVISAHADKKDAIECLKHGAYDFFEKPVGQVELLKTIERTLTYRQVVRQRDELADRISLVTEQESKKWGIQAFVGSGSLMKDLLSKVRRLQKSMKTNVLVLGESGTGKELVARAIHFGSARAEAPFVAVNCSAIPDDLAESILFGHVKGAFTGAVSDRKGQFEMANGGTLFLDEIGDMPSLVQTKLLRVLEDGIVVPVGKVDGTHVDVRVVSATNTDLKEKIDAGKFREDLFHRLSAYVIDVPPLRDRLEDLPDLVEHFAEMLSGEMGVAKPAVSKEFLKALRSHQFSGNVRELRNILERALIDAAGSDLDVQHLPFCAVDAKKASTKRTTAATPPAEKSSSLCLKDAEREHVQKVLDGVQGNIAEASRQLGISRAKIYRILG